MKYPARRMSTKTSIVCPRCEIGEVLPEGPGNEVVRCNSCGRSTRREVFDYLQQLAALPGVTGAHACECGHPEMRLLPDGVFWCPSCGAEVLPVRAGSVLPAAGKRSRAYWDGWVDGRYREAGSMARNSRLARWEDARDRLEYYRGHREGREARARSEHFSTTS